MWLECAVEETDERGRKTRTTEARDNRRGIPQGSPISPLLANLYMRRFVLGWKMFGLEMPIGTTCTPSITRFAARGGTVQKASTENEELTGPMNVPVLRTQNCERGDR